MQDSVDIGKELRKYRLGSDAAKKIIGRRLLNAGTEMSDQIDDLTAWLDKGDRLLPQDRREATFTEQEESREATWLRKHDELVRLLKMRDMIEKEVLR